MMPPPADPTPPAPLLSLDEAEAQAWRALERRLRQLHGFGLLVYFVRTPLLAQRLRERLSLHLAAQQRSLLTTAVTHPEDMAQISLQSLFVVPDGVEVGAHWLEAYRGAGQASWDAERRQLLTRLNERRSRLEAEFRAPLILLLPAGGAAEMADLAPDLWHIRVQTVVLSARIDRFMPQGLHAESRAEPLYELDRSASLQVEPEVSQALQYWLSQWRVNFDDYGGGELPPEHPNLWALSLWDGVRAVDVCLSYGRFQQAHGVARDLLSLARIRALHAKEDQRNSALRDVSVSLNKVGAVAQAQGDWSGAEAVYRESLEIRRQLVQRLGGTPEALRDVSVSLEKVGEVAQAQGDWSGAEAVYRESLEIRRQLVQRLGGTPEALRDVSVSLNKVGAVAQAQGDWSGAEAVYRESLEISRQLVQRLGGTPQALRDVSVSLEKVGAVVQAQGDWSGAEAVYRESLEIRRQLVQRLGGTPQALDDLGVALVRSAWVPNGPAHELLAEAATIYAALVQRCPQVQRYADHLKLVRDQLAASTTPDPELPSDSK